MGPAGKKQKLIKNCLIFGKDFLNHFEDPNQKFASGRFSNSKTYCYQNDLIEAVAHNADSCFVNQLHDADIASKWFVFDGPRKAQTHNSND